MKTVMRLRDTDADVFIRWFNYHTRDVIPTRLYVSEDVSLTLQGPEINTVDVGVANIRVSGAFVVTKDGDTLPPEWAPSIFTFRLVSLPFGLRVEADCYNMPSVIVSFLEVLVSIARDWEGRATVEHHGRMNESLDTDRDLTVEDRYFILRAMELENELLLPRQDPQEHIPETSPVPETHPADEPVGKGAKMGDLWRRWQADEIETLDLVLGLHEQGIKPSELSGVHQGTSPNPAKQVELLDLARRYLELKTYNPDATQEDVGAERTVRRGKALYKAIEKLA